MQFSYFYRNTNETKADERTTLFPRECITGHYLIVVRSDPMTCDSGSRIYDPDRGTLIPDPTWLRPCDYWSNTFSGLFNLFPWDRESKCFHLKLISFSSSVAVGWKARGYGGPYLQTQQTLLQTQHSIIWTQQTIIETQHSIIEAHHNIIETQHSIIETQHNVIETQHKISKHNSEFAKHNANLSRILCCVSIILLCASIILCCVSIIVCCV